MRIVVSYDITDDAVRRQVVKVCETFGQRIQKSVFECALSTEQLQEMIRQLDIARKSENATSTDSIRIYRLCAECSIQTSVLGFSPTVVTKAGHAVI